MPIRRDLRHLYKSPAWLAARDACLTRAENRCAHCGIHGGAVVSLPCRGCAGSGRIADDCAGVMRCHTCGGRGERKSRIQIGVAHLDQDPTNNSPENLAALCRACHLKHDLPHHIHARTVTRDRWRRQMRFDDQERPR